MNKTFYKISLLIVCIIWMAFIFYMSSKAEQQSKQMSLHIVNIITNNNHLNHNISYIDRLNYIVRKNGHAFEYMLLSFILSLVFVAFGKKYKNSIIYIMFICLFYAVTDEFHQFFVSGRQSRVSDILIDFIGSNIGILIFLGISRLKIHTKQSLLNK